MLKRVRHPSGQDILFDSKWHRYTLGNTTLRPVSKLLDRYFPFDEKRILGLVAKKTGETTAAVKQSWTRQALLGKNIHAYIESRLLEQPVPTFVLLLRRRAAAVDARDAAATGPRPTSPAAHATSSSQLEEEMLHGEEAAYMAVADTAVDAIKAAYDVIAVEQVVASPSWGLASTIDVLARHKRTGRVLIGDWKTSGSTSSNFRFGSYETACPGCLRHLPNTKAHRYAMQVIVYGEMLKQERYFEAGYFDANLRRVLGGGKGNGGNGGEDDDDESAAATPTKTTATTRGKAKKKQRSRDTDAAAATTTSTASTGSCADVALQRTLDDYHASMEGKFDYGVVQLDKNDAGDVAVSFRGVEERSVLPPDTCEMTFRRLLLDVVAGG